MNSAIKTPSDTIYFGPIALAPGITRINVSAKLFTAFVAIAMLSGMSFLQPYILTEHLNIPRNQHGTVSGNLAFWTEIVAILLYSPFGILGDRIGRRPVLVFGILMMGLGFGLYPYATSTTELTVFRMAYAVGMTATTGMLATISNDYPQDRSRGKLIGLSAMFNVTGTIFMSLFVARIPYMMIEQGFDPIAGGKAMYLFAAMLCLTAALVGKFWLAEGTVVKKKERAAYRELIISGFHAGRNPRIAIAYASAFIARADMVIKAMFLALWAIQAGSQMGLRPDQAMARFGIMYVAMYAVSFFSAPIFGWYIDKVNRVTSMITALAIAAAGYLAMRLIDSPLELSSMPFLMLLTLGSSCMLKASLSLVGQEAPARERGSIISFSSMCGAVGILIFTLVGGRLFDSWAPWAPFYIAGVYQVVLLVFAIVVRKVAPGANPK
ncbi:MAG: MFS transporter [Pseudomonadota bacterium]|nr:MFS transporter [Pseudomonadota bacterium]